MARFSEIADTDLKYASINDKVSKDATDLALNYPSKTIPFEDYYDIHYRVSKENASKALAFIEKEIGRDLTSDEMVKIYDLIDIGGLFGSSVRVFNSDEEENISNTLSYIYKKGIKALKCISMSISAGFFDELYDRAIDIPERLGIEYNNSFNYHNIIRAYNEIMEKKYGVPEKKPEDTLPTPEEEPLSREDQLNLEDFEEIYED